LFACGKSNWHCWSFISTLAAAYATAGEFETAVKCSHLSIKMAPSDEVVSESDMLRRFESRSIFEDD
jgi:hypothetical protein